MEHRVLVAIRRIIRAVDLYSRQLLEECGLTGPQLVALEEMSRVEAISAADLARRMQVSQPTVTGILERLQRRGLIVRARNGDDRRSIDVSITKQGLNLLKTAPPLLQKKFCQRLDELQEWEQTLILATLQRVASMMEAEDVDAAPHLISGPDRL